MDLSILKFIMRLAQKMSALVNVLCTFKKNMKNMYSVVYRVVL